MTLASSNFLSRILTILTLLCAIAGEGAAQSVPTGFQVDVIISAGLPQPLDFLFLPDGRVLIANRAGELQIYAGGTLASVGTIPSVITGGESGLLSIEIDPGFAQSGYVYAFYSSSVDAYRHLDRFELVGDLSDPTSTNLTLSLPSRRVILDAIPDNTPFHNGGTTRIGPDGMLYLSLGDDSWECDAQSTTSARGCLVRMDVSNLPAGGAQTAPAFASLDPGDNPLSANADFSQLIIANGLRNPFRFTIDALTGNLYIGDVGSATAEEVNEYAYASGSLPLRNYGWPWTEGNGPHGNSCGGSAPSGMQAPIASRLQTAGWASLIQGPRYRNQGGPFDFGPSYEGSVFFADYWRGWIQRVEYTTAWAAAPPVAGHPSPQNWADTAHRITAMRQGPDGAVYWTQGPLGAGGGTLRRVRPNVASLVATFGAGCGSPVFDLAGSSPPVIGTTAQAVLSNAPTPFAFLAIGWSNTFRGSAPLPLPLAGIGMPGCELLQSAEVLGLAATPTGTGTATYDWPLPNLGSLIGLQAYLQGWALAPGQNAAGLIVSNGLEWRIGNS